MPGYDLTMPVRFDSSPLSAPKKSSQGFLVADAFLTRSGIFSYRRADGTTIRELRHPDDVFRADSLASIAMLPLTNDHPSSPVTADNAKTLSVGVVGQPVREGDKVRAQVVVQDARTIAVMRATKKHQISMGYTCDMLEESGIWQGEHYDARQTNIEYNHAAIVAVGRAGPEVHLRMDAAETLFTEDTPKMHKIRIDGVDFEVSESAAQAFAKLETIHVAAKADADKAAARADAATAELASVKTQLQNATAGDTIRVAVQARVALETVAARVLGGEGYKAQTDSDIRKAIIAKHSPSMKLDGKSEDYVQASFDYVVAALDKETATQNLAPLALAGQAAQHQDSEDKLTAAIAGYHKRIQNAHKEQV